MEPLISVIIPVYRVEKYLHRCVASIAAQTYGHLEIILVDDGSPDSCGKMCDEWAEKDPRIRVIHRENGGLGDARNAGLRTAAGEFVCFVDSDDWVEPKFVEAMYEALRRTGAQIAECGVNLVGEDGGFLRLRAVPDEGVLTRRESLCRLVSEDGIYQTVWNKLYRRDVIDGIPFPKGKCHEDDFWTYRVFDRAQTLATVALLLYNYRQRIGSIMGDPYSLRRLDGLEARFLRMGYLQKYPETAVLARRQFLFDCMYHCQCALRCLRGAERAQALGRIRDLAERTPPLPRSRAGDGKSRLWLALFRAMPTGAAALRNRLGIGV